MPHLHVAVRPGDGLIARSGETVIAIAEDADDRATADLLDAIEVATAEGADPAVAVTRRLAGQLASGAAPVFGLICPAADGLLVLLRGPVRADVSSAGGVESFSGAGSLTWLDRRIDLPVDGIDLKVGLSELPASRRSDLQAGQVPGGGFVLTFGSGPHGLADDVFADPTGPLGVGGTAPPALSPAEPAPSAAEPALSPAEPAPSAAGPAIEPDPEPGQPAPAGAGVRLEKAAGPDEVEDSPAHASTLPDQADGAEDDVEPGFRTTLDDEVEVDEPGSAGRATVLTTPPSEPDPGLWPTPWPSSTTPPDDHGPSGPEPEPEPGPGAPAGRDTVLASPTPPAMPEQPKTRDTVPPSSPRLPASLEAALASPGTPRPEPEPEPGESSGRPTMLSSPPTPVGAEDAEGPAPQTAVKTHFVPSGTPIQAPGPPSDATVMSDGAEPGPPEPGAPLDTEVTFLAADDGSRLVLDRSYVIGREPGNDPAVMERSAAPITVDDPESLISRVQVYVSVTGGDVWVRDASSANGTFIAAAGAPAWTRLGPEAAVLPLGWSMRIGKRIFTHVPTDA